MVPIWHYTTSPGLSGILDSGTLFATNVLYLNDATEYRLLTEVAAEITSAELGGEFSDLLSIAIRKVVSERSLRELPPVYVACVSQAGDQLSQWKGYSRGENGYAIEFHPSKFRVTAQQHGTVAMCQYMENDSAKKNLCEVIRNMEDIIGTVIDRSREKQRSIIDEYVQILFTHLPSVYPFLKNKGFAEEKEWRVILSNPPLKDVKFRPKGTMLSAYVELPLTDRDDKGRAIKPIESIRSVLVGPGQYADISALAVKQMLRQKGYALEEDDEENGVKVRVSSLPFRWA